MAADIATFGFAIDSSQVATAARNLDSMATSSQRAAQEAIKARQISEQQAAELKKLVAVQQQYIDELKRASQTQEQYNRGLVDSLTKGANFAMWITGVSGALAILRMSMEGARKAGEWMTGDYFQKISDGARIAAVQLKGYALETSASVAATESFFRGMSRNTASIETQVNMLSRLTDIIRGTSAQAIEARTALSQMGVNASQFGAGQEDRLFAAASQALDQYRDGYEKTQQVVKIFGSASAEVQLALIQGIRDQTEAEKKLALQKETFYRRDIQMNREIIALEDQKRKKQREEEVYSERMEFGRALANQGSISATRSAQSAYDNGTYSFMDSMRAEAAWWRWAGEALKQPINSVIRFFGGSGFSPMEGTPDQRGAAPLTPEAIVSETMRQMQTLRPMESLGVNMMPNRIGILNEALGRLPEDSEQAKSILIERNQIQRQYNMIRLQDEMERIKNEEAVNGQYLEKMKDNYKGLIAYVKELGETSSREGIRAIASMEAQIAVIEQRQAVMREQSRVQSASNFGAQLGIYGQAVSLRADADLATGRGTQSGVTNARLSAANIGAFASRNEMAMRRQLILTQFRGNPDSQEARDALRAHDEQAATMEMRAELERAGIIANGDYSGRYGRSRAVEVIGINSMTANAGRSQTDRAVAARMAGVDQQYFDMRDDRAFMSRVRGDAMSNMRAEGAAASTSRVSDLNEEIRLQRELAKAAQEGPAAFAQAQDRINAVRESYGKLGYDIEAVTASIRAQRMEIERTNFNQWREGVSNATAASNRMADAFMRGGNAGVMQGIENQARDRVRGFEGGPEHEVRLQQAILELKNQQGARDRENWSQRFRILQDEADALNKERNAIVFSAGAREEILTIERETLRLRRETVGLSEEQIRLIAEYEGKVARVRRENEDWKNMAGSIAQTISGGWEEAIMQARNYGQIAESVLSGVQRIVFRTLIGKPIENFITSALSNLFGSNIPKPEEAAVNQALIAAKSQETTASAQMAAAIAVMEAAVQSATPQVAALSPASQMATSAVAELAMACQQAAEAIRQAASMVGGGGGGGFGPLGGGGFFGDGAGLGGGGDISWDVVFGGGDGAFPVDMVAADMLAMPFADGGVMTSRGKMPLKKYSRGGVARTPQLAMFGEGDMAEAYVPLPDGRSIPVTMNGAAGVKIEIIDQRGAGAPPIEQESSTGPDGMQMIRLLIREENAQAQRDGALDRSMKTNFGISRNPISR